MQNDLYDIESKKQVLMYQLICLLDIRKLKLKSALKANYTAQTILQDLNE